MTRFTVADVMTPDAVSASENATYHELVELMESRSVSSVPVVDDFRRVLGVVSASDLVYKMEFAGGAQPPRPLEGRSQRAHRAKAARERAGELMTSPAVTVPVGSSVVTAARLMESTGVKHVPVVDDLGRLVGVVSRRDLLKVFLRTDAELADEIRREVLPAVVGEPADGVDVDVCDGSVTLAGEVGERSSAEVVALMVERLDGVVSVVNGLTYRHDDVEPRLGLRLAPR